MALLVTEIIKISTMTFTLIMNIVTVTVTVTEVKRMRATYNDNHDDDDNDDDKYNDNLNNGNNSNDDDDDDFKKNDVKRDPNNVLITNVAMLYNLLIYLNLNNSPCVCSFANEYLCNSYFVVWLCLLTLILSFLQGTNGM